jgi:hypothetical protein
MAASAPMTQYVGARRLAKKHKRAATPLKDYRRK